ncbi:CpaF family protein [Thermophilibacter provencensis]|uniref:CpaF family protein n=1 Tax=Thermophilibacter provencensis TaxID=1852386 RepID=A0ABT7V1M4_9ACTN|nr:CpaF family protein [Thermophilibacter provencensis]MDM8270371.1 CpaF family protein [Thermophilibacter provencensis]
MGVLERVREVEREHDAAPALATRARLRSEREALKGRLIERLGLATIASMLAEGDVRQARSEIRVVLEAILNTQEHDSLDANERETLLRQVIDEVCGLGPIQPLLEDDQITEVMINGCGALFFERGGELYPADAVFDSPEQIMIVMDRILAPLGRRLDRASPIVNARLSNGDRVNAVAAPIAIDGPAVTIRKFSDRIRSLSRLVDLGSLPAWFAQILSWAVRVRRSIAVAGGTGSGKTTLLNALSCEIPVGERIVTIEDSAELRFDTHPNVVRLEARDSSIEGSGEITIRELVKNALRMRPDRIVVGEVRGEECVDMLNALSTGHDGSLTTLHAGSAEEAVMRLVLMARFGMDLPTNLIEEQIATAIDLIVVTRRLADGTRVVTSLTDVSRGPGGAVQLDERVSFDLASRSWRLVAEPTFVATALEDGLLDAGEVESWRSLFP